MRVWKATFIVSDGLMAWDNLGLGCKDKNQPCFVFMSKLYHIHVVCISRPSCARDHTRVSRDMRQETCNLGEVCCKENCIRFHWTWLLWESFSFCSGAALDRCIGVLDHHVSMIVWFALLMLFYFAPGTLIWWLLSHKGTGIMATITSNYDSKFY